MHNLDLRIQRTLTAIKDAFVTLTIEKGFEQMSVQDLCRTAGINRATFYRHYKDKFDLAERLTDLLFVDNRPIDYAAYTQNPRPALIAMFEHVAEYGAFYLAMIGPHGVPGFRDRVQQAVEREIQALLTATSAAPPSGAVPPALAIRYLAAAQVGLIQWWLEQERPLSPTRMANHLIALHQQGGLSALYGQNER